MNTGDRVLIEFDPQSRRQAQPWDEDPDPLWLLTPEELTWLPAGTPLEDITGEQAVTGLDRIDDDTRFGYLAYGLREHQLPPSPVPWRALLNGEVFAP